MNFDETILYRFILGQTTEVENEQIAQWLEADPVTNRKRFKEVYNIYLLGSMGSAGTSSKAPTSPPLRLGIWRRSAVRYAMGFAASLMLAFGMSYLFFSYRVSEWTNQTTTIEAPAGQQTRLTLNDGSVVNLASGSRIVYPSIFSGKERRVKLCGEAMFEVSHDASHPFIVETFACDVKVLGTRFNVEADESENLFTTALLQGSVCVTDRRTREQVLMEPYTVVRLENGRLNLSQVDNVDDYLWTEGIINAGGVPFDKLMARLEKFYNIKIEMQRSDLPVIRFNRCKIRIADGIDHAMKILQLSSDFEYEHISEENTVIIK